VLDSYIAVSCSIIIYLCIVPSAHAIPAFARQYGTSCARWEILKESK